MYSTPQPKKRIWLSVWLIVACSGVLIVGLWSVITGMIDSLEENSKQLHKLQVKPSGANTGEEPLEMAAAGHFFSTPPKPTSPTADDSISSGAGSAPSSNSSVDDIEDVHKQSNRLFTLGRQAARRGDFRRAIDLFTTSHKIMSAQIQNGQTEEGDSEGIAERFSALGYCYFKLGDLDSAGKELTWAIQSSPHTPAYRLQRAQIYRQQGKRKLADQDVQTGKKLSADPFQSPMAEGFEAMFGSGSPAELTKSRQAARPLAERSRLAAPSTNGLP